MPLVCNFPFFSIFLPILSAILCLSLKGKTAQRVSLAAIAVNCLLSTGVLSYTLQSGESFTYMMGHFPAPFGNELRVGPLETFLALAFCLITLLSIIGGIPDISKDIPADKLSYYFIMINLLLASMLALLYTNDIFTAYVFIEILTIAACSLVMAKPGGKTLIATTSYLFMSLIGSTLLLLAISLLYSVTGHLLFPNLYQAIRVLAETGQYNLPLFILAGCLTVGLAIKSALFPFHGWLPDAHSGATTASSSILSGLILKSYLILLIKLIFLVFGIEVFSYLQVNNILMTLGVCGILYGSVAAIRSGDVKRMLSYASISQIGYICFCIGVNTVASIAAACFHILMHALGKSMLFASAGGLIRASDGKKDFASLRGAGLRDKTSGVAFACGALCMIGVPPFSGFASKLYLTAAATGFSNTSILIFAVIVLSSILSAVYYLPAVVCFFTKTAQQERSVAKSSLSSRAALVSFVALNTLLGLVAQPVYQIIRAGIDTLVR